MSKTAWDLNCLQFPRLLAEIRAVGLSTEQESELAASMDLDLEQIAEIFERAEDEWEVIKGLKKG